MRKILAGIVAGLLLATFGCGGGNFGSSRFGGGPQQTKFTAGIAHVAGNYGFTTNNFLIEGAQKISQFGSDSIFVYLTPWFRNQQMIGPQVIHPILRTWRRPNRTTLYLTYRLRRSFLRHTLSQTLTEWPEWQARLHASRPKKTRFTNLPSLFAFLRLR